MGKVYIVGSLIAGLSALRLSLINDCHACRYSLLLLSVLLLFFTSAAYYSIRKYNIEAHKQFMIRSYVCALAFVSWFGIVVVGCRVWFSEVCCMRGVSQYVASCMQQP